MRSRRFRPGPVETYYTSTYHESGSYLEVRSRLYRISTRTNVPLTSIPNMPGTLYVRPTRPVNELSSLRASAGQL